MNDKPKELKETHIADVSDSFGAPTPGARKVYFRQNGEWVAKGWLMPERKGVGS